MEAPVTIYTDGGCSGNPGPGGWAFIIVQETDEGNVVLAEQYGAERATTNNRMELRAVIESLRTLDTFADVSRNITVLTDSQYVQKGITEWITAWKLNAWRTSNKKPVKNQDLWMELDSISSNFTLAWEWIRGHSGIAYNEHCDRLTQQAIASIEV